MLQIFNSLTRQKEEFRPIEPGKVRMYVCGMTVYDYCHVGHARVMVVFDVVLRWLRAKGYDVTYVRNITDIDDKIIRRAQENGEDFHALTDRFIQAMHEDLDGAGHSAADPRAARHRGDGRHDRHDQTLLDKGFAYVGARRRCVLRREPLRALRTIGQQEAGRSAGGRADRSRRGQGAIRWISCCGKPPNPVSQVGASPWGAGRPGWHIECSAMSTHCLGEHFDIHGGGMDLKFPHHENEIAQSEAASGHRYVNFWMHNGFVQVNEEKMSKSLGNFFTVREVLQRYQPEVVRLFILASHYRGPLNYADENLDHAKASLNRLVHGVARFADQWTRPIDEGWRARFEQAMDDDFNTPEALAVLFELAREINRLRD
jgi:cysteinyl-tRNA synthetase